MKAEWLQNPGLPLGLPIDWAHQMIRNWLCPETTINPIIRTRTRSREEGKRMGGGGKRSSSLHGILQTRILEWVAIPFSRDLPEAGIEPWSPTLQADSFPTESLGSPYICTHTLKFPIQTVNSSRVYRHSLASLHSRDTERGNGNIKKSEKVSFREKLLSTKVATWLDDHHVLWTCEELGEHSQMNS